MNVFRGDLSGISAKTATLNMGSSMQGASQQAPDVTPPTQTSSSMVTVLVEHASNGQTLLASDPSHSTPTGHTPESFQHSHRDDTTAVQSISRGNVRNGGQFVHSVDSTGAAPRTHGRQVTALQPSHLRDGATSLNLRGCECISSY